MMILLIIFPLILSKMAFKMLCYGLFAFFLVSTVVLKKAPTLDFFACLFNY